MILLYVYIFIFFQIPFHHRFLQDVLYSRSLLFISFMHSSMYMLIPHISHILPITIPSDKHNFVFYVCESISVLEISSFILFFSISHVSDII